MQKYEPQRQSNGAQGNETTKNAIIAGAAGFGLGLLAAAGRKAAVQAVTYAAGDWVEGLTAEHKAAMAIIELMEQTTADDAGKRKALLFQLQHALGKHAIQEEDVIYCALRDSGMTQEADKLNEEHGYIKQYLYDLEMMDKTDGRWLDKVSQLKSLIQSHVRMEEDELYPPLRARMTDEQNKKLTNRMNREGFKVA